MTPESVLFPISPRLQYRAPRIEDWSALVSYRRHPDFLRFYQEEDYGRDEATALLERFVGWESEEPQVKHAFATLTKDTGAFVGVCSIRRDSVDAPWAEMGFELDHSLWGQGYGTEMGRAILGLGFERMGLHRIQAHCIAENTASARVLRKIGMTDEGTLRQKHFFKDRYWDERWFGILRPEWEAGRGRAGEKAEL